MPSSRSGARSVATQVRAGRSPVEQEAPASVEEAVVDLQHQPTVDLVGAGGQRRGHVEQPHPHVVADVGRPGLARLVEQEGQRIARWRVPGADGPHQVDRQQEAPEVGVRARGDGEEVDDLDLVGREPLVELRPHAVGDEAVRVHRVEQRAESVPAVLAIEEEEVPPAVVAPDGTRRGAAPAVVQTREQRAGLLGLDHPHRPALGDVAADLGGAPVDLEPADLGGRAVAEPAVDAALRRAEDRDGVALLEVRAMLLEEHRGEDAPAAVRGVHRHPRHPGRGQRAAGHGHVELVVAGQTDDVGAVEGQEEAIDVEDEPGVRQVLLGVAEAEVPAVDMGERRPVGLGGAADGDVHGRAVSPLPARSSGDLPPTGSDPARGRPPRCRARTAGSRRRPVRG